MQLPVTAYGGIDTRNHREFFFVFQIGLEDAAAGFGLILRTPRSGDRPRWSAFATPISPGMRRPESVPPQDWYSVIESAKTKREAFGVLRTHVFELLSQWQKTVHTVTLGVHPSIPGRCLNCDRTLEAPQLFCSELCKQTARWVRKTRRWRDEDRLWEPDIAYAIEVGLAHILAGGYPERTRTLSPDVRSAVKARDSSVCQICGQPGEEIDHISGSSNELTNLRLLCSECHRRVTREHLVPASAEQTRKANELWGRVDSLVPIRICDDYTRWNGRWREVLAEQERHFSCSDS